MILSSWCRAAGAKRDPGRQSSRITGNRDPVMRFARKGTAN
jgi:hypothetical protein